MDGVGAMPDAAEYGDAGSNTLSHLADAVGGLDLPTLEALGLGHITEIKGVQVMGQPEGCFGRLGFLSKGCVFPWSAIGDGGPSDGRCRSSLNQFPPTWLRSSNRIGRKVIGNRRSSGAAMLRECGAEHLSSGALIVWTERRRTCHVAAHDRAMRPDKFFQRCRDAKKLLRSLGNLAGFSPSSLG